MRRMAASIPEVGFSDLLDLPAPRGSLGARGSETADAADATPCVPAGDPRWRGTGSVGHDGRMRILGGGETRAFVGAALAAALVIGCWPVESGTGGGGAGGSTAAGPLTGTDIQVCGGACDKLISCGVELNLDDCKASCIDPGSAALITCFRGVDAACNPLASCVWAAICGAAPSGSASCSAARDCALNCAGAASTTCGCSCAAQAASGVSVNYYAVAVCSNVHCGYECGVNGDPGSCQGCLASQCEAASSNCQ